MTRGDDTFWFALRVVPQKEYVVAHLLEKRSEIFAYVPTASHYRRRTRYSKAGAEYAKPEMPGCLFARFPAEPAWYDVLKNHLILGPIGRNGEPWQFHARELFSYFAHTPNGTLILSKGEPPQIFVAGRLLRAPTTQVRNISKRGKGNVVEPTRQEETALQGLVSIPEAVRIAA